MPQSENRYLGDGVYASSDGYHIILDLRAQDSTTRIVLEPEVFKELIRYAQTVNEGEFLIGKNKLESLPHD